MLVPVVAAVIVRTEVNIISAVGSDLIVVVHAVGIPCPILTGFILDDLDRVGIGKGNIVQHELVALSLGILSEQIVVVDLPLGHGADNIVACLMLCGTVEYSGVGNVAGNCGQLSVGSVGVLAVSPSRESIGVVVILCLFGLCAVIDGGRSGYYVLVGFKYFVAVHPCDGVGGNHNMDIRAAEYGSVLLAVSNVAGAFFVL